MNTPTTSKRLAVAIAGSSLLAVLVFFSVRQPREEARAASVVQGYELRVPSDPKAVFRVLSVRGTWPMRQIVTRRESPSGLTFSEREVDCGENRIRYLGSGESPEEMRRNRHDDPFGPIVEESIAWYVAREACQGRQVEQ